MTVWFVFAVPLVVMFFALFMERVEARLRHVAVQEDEVEEFLEQARPDEVRALYGHGIGRALEHMFRRDGLDAIRSLLCIASAADAGHERREHHQGCPREPHRPKCALTARTPSPLRLTGPASAAWR